MPTLHKISFFKYYLGNILRILFHGQLFHGIFKSKERPDIKTCWLFKTCPIRVFWVNLSIKTIIKIVQYFLLYTMSHLLTSNLWHNWRKTRRKEKKAWNRKQTKKVLNLYLYWWYYNNYWQINKDHVSSS